MAAMGLRILGLVPLPRWNLDELSFHLSTHTLHLAAFVFLPLAMPVLLPPHLPAFLTYPDLDLNLNSQHHEPSNSVIHISLMT